MAARAGGGVDPRTAGAGRTAELDTEHAAMLLRLLSAGADSVDVTLSVGIRLTGDPDEGELALLSPHMDGSETAQVWQLTVEAGRRGKEGGCRL